MVSMGNRDDNFDWQLGSDVKVQYGVTAQYKPNNDPLEDNGFEGDGNERGYTNLAMSQPQFCNMTLVGNKGQSPTIAGGHWWGALLRRGTAAQIAKTIWYNWNDGVINMRDPETGGQACTGTCSSRADGVTACTDVPYPFALPTYEPSQGTCAFGTHHGEDCTPGVGGDAFCGTANSCQKKQNLLIRNSLFYDNGSDHITHAVNRSGGANTGANCNSTEWFALLQADPSLRVLANTSYPDSATDPGIQAGPYWPPVSFVPANASNVADDPAGDGFDCGVHFSSFFDSTTYMGAFDPNGADWTITPGGWISYATQ
jgi:hypothetical protein